MTTLLHSNIYKTIFSLDMNLSFEHSDEERLNLDLANIKQFKCYQNYSKMTPALKFSEVKILNFQLKFSIKKFNHQLMSFCQKIVLLTVALFILIELRLQS